MFLRHTTATMLLSGTMIFSQYGGAEEEPPPDVPQENSIPASELPANVLAAFRLYLPQQKPENCKWSYTTFDQQRDWNKKKNKYMKVVKVRQFSTGMTPCPLNASDPQSPDVLFQMGEHEKKPGVSAYLSEKSSIIPPSTLAKARELAKMKSVHQASVQIGPGGRVSQYTFHFMQGLTSCNVNLDSDGKEMEKTVCTQGAYGGAD